MAGLWACPIYSIRFPVISCPAKPVRFRGPAWTERLPVRFEWLAAA
jgi:hypothetical protein